MKENDFVDYLMRRVFVMRFRSQSTEFRKHYRITDIAEAVLGRSSWARTKFKFPPKN